MRVQYRRTPLFFFASPVMRIPLRTAAYAAPHAQVYAELPPLFP